MNDIHRMPYWEKVVVTANRNGNAFIYSNVISVFVCVLVYSMHNPILINWHQNHPCDIHESVCLFRIANSPNKYRYVYNNSSYMCAYIIRSSYFFAPSIFRCRCNMLNEHTAAI